MEDFVTYEQAQRLKALGFDWDCMKGYSHFPGESVRTLNAQEENINGKYSKWCYSAPTLAQAQKWLREVKGIFVDIFLNASGYGWELCKATPIYATNGTRIKHFDYKGEHEDSGMWLTYEEALSAGIDMALERLKEQKHGNKA